MKNTRKKVAQTRELVDAVRQQGSSNPLKSLMNFLEYDLPLPNSIIDWLGKLALLYGVPFNNLVPDKTMLTNSPGGIQKKITAYRTAEAKATGDKKTMYKNLIKDTTALLANNPEVLESNCLRFFYLDINWIDTMIDGALSIATQDSADFAFQQAVHETFRKNILRAMLNYRTNLLTPNSDSPADLFPVDLGTLSGLLVRSPIIKEWPGIEIHAYSTDDMSEITPDTEATYALQVLRMERLAPDTMIVIFSGQFAGDPTDGPNSGVPKMIIIKEPSESVYNGFQGTGASAASDTYNMTFRDFIPVAGADKIGVGQPLYTSDGSTPAAYALKNSGASTDFRDYDNRVLDIGQLVKNVKASYPATSGKSGTPITPPAAFGPKEMAIMFINSPRNFVYNPGGTSSD